MGKIVYERKAADPLLTGLLLLMRFSVFAAKLFSGDSTGGASTLASAAIDASVCIHNCNTILNGDSTNGASALASAAANTCVRNLVCHNKLSFFIPCRCNYEETYLGTATHAPRNLYPCLHSNKAGRKRQD